MEDNLKIKFQTIYSNIITDKGNGYLFAMLKMDEYVDKWSVLISAPWITRENQRESFSYISTKIQEVLTQQELTNIARIGIFQPDEHIVGLFNSSIRVQTGGSPVRLENTKINGFQIHEAYIFESTPPVI